jgi:hypothetical protein
VTPANTFSLHTWAQAGRSAHSHGRRAGAGELRPLVRTAIISNPLSRVRRDSDACKAKHSLAEVNLEPDLRGTLNSGVSHRCERCEDMRAAGDAELAPHMGLDSGLWTNTSGLALVHHQHSQTMHSHASSLHSTNAGQQETTADVETTLFAILCGVQIRSPNRPNFVARTKATGTNCRLRRLARFARLPILSCWCSRTDITAIHTSRQPRRSHRWSFANECENVETGTNPRNRVAAKWSTVQYYSATGEGAVRSYAPSSPTTSSLSRSTT